ncbi:MAG: hypothetical protein ACLQEQ_04320 [Nitrososphaerales archaeon]
MGGFKFPRSVFLKAAMAYYVAHEPMTAPSSGVGTTNSCKLRMLGPGKNRDGW